MHVFGLTGGIGSGKSTVTRMLRELGAEVLDADVLAREVVEPGTPGLAAIAERFPGVVGPDGRLDRAKLGAHVFGNDTERAALNAITHPRVREAFMEKLEALTARGVERVIYDVPLLIEAGMHEWMEGVALVWVPRDLQKARLMARDGLDATAAEARLAAQLPLDDKRVHATWVIDNSQDLSSTREQVESVWRAMLARG
ncbi:MULTISPECIES: dephospho-CoA kinase [Myxococcus]|uniref:Dephospho-CoA kinase n=1 Tax=Myxococcus llanfairpwllgwyngyllgogerychwyrndrobwllllantysiliogogogochensis TaxID=2590453 RepID=A0A540WS99_9BACT|nr:MULTISPECIES: dephospho-CoA kinase [Myxococcus]NTX03612.1 dephospho-CoA kinase [Myxococcus sp. CA040A]NTX35379.1 dephospho-CoA kinase [Myxococcus sp. CA033]NTX56041.1 dephospho-CoA kinase [Myxococcus sp. CA039A]TQF11901.1 dephospho-CoA kinase [Myxococcus llanfairpwllgwyngyllgogerychwyrndrobwllllantysiliogogogochensis]